MSGIIVLILRVLMAASLFLFLLISLGIIWKDLTRKTNQLSLQKMPHIALTSINEDIHHKINERLNEFEVGRDASCEVSIQDDSISAKHARFSFHHEHWWLEDLKSTNGTFLNGEKITTAVVLSNGDNLRFGKHEMQVSFMESI